MSTPYSQPHLVPVQSKLKRTKPFYIGQYEALKALTKPEV